jgi:futalosine hydrolase
MSFKLLYVTATAVESDTLRSKLQNTLIRDISSTFDLHFLVTGVGSIATAWSMKQWLEVNGKPDLAINAGIAGSFSDKIPVGEVVLPISDCFADSGIEEGPDLITLFEAGLMDPDAFPYKSGQLHCDNMYTDKIKTILKTVRAITVNTSTGSESSKIKLMGKFNPDIETMEGATFFYICCKDKIPFLAIRSISNKVEARNKNNWNIPLALDNLSEKIVKILLMLQ